MTWPRTRARAGLIGALWTGLSPVWLGGAAQLAGVSLTMTWFLVGLVAGAALSAWAYVRARRRARFDASPSGVVLDIQGNLERVPTSSIANAMTVQIESKGQLVIHRDDGSPLVIDFDTAEAASRALSALALDRRRSVIRIPLYSTTQHITANFGGGFFGFGAGIIPCLLTWTALGRLGAIMALAMMIPFIFGGAWVLRRFLPLVTIGADGVAFGSSTNSKVKFMRYEEIDCFQAIRRDGHKSRNGWAIDVIPSAGKARQITHFPAGEYALAEALVVRIEAAMAEKRDRGDPVISLSEIERQGEDAVHWLERLRSFADAKGDYRRARIDDERLLAALADGDAPLDQRVAAGMMLRIRSPREGRIRSREAAECAADPEAREALLALAEAEEDEAALERASRRTSR